jgi:nitrate reductase beta subunit
MAHEVFNWQINRKMTYWYPEHRPRRQFAAVFDINKCIACQTCSLGCKTTWTSGKGQELMFWNNVETKPWGGYPTGWDVRILSLLGPQKWGAEEYEGATIFEAAPKGERVLQYSPEDEDWCNVNLGEDECSRVIEKGAYLKAPHATWFFYLQRICNHCTYPACLTACPRGAIYKRQEDGVVLIDQKNCRGHRECLKACPYKRIFFNVVTGTSEKCIACFPSLESGRCNLCFETCIGKIRLQGWINPPDKAQEDNPVDFLVHIRKVALPLYPQFGTEPNVYYIPPKHVDPVFSRQMFGPGVDKAIATYRNAKNDPELLGLLLLQGSSDRVIERFKVRGGMAIGYTAKGAEIVRVPLKEPLYVRPYLDVALNVHRFNVT